MARNLLAAAALAAVAAGAAAAKTYNTKAAPGGIVPGAINVHMVPHTHDDVGWLKTVDQYFMGQNNSIQFAAVQYVLDSVMVALSENPDRRFIYVEQAFFQRWWAQQDAAKQAQVKQLVSAGQLEFINGGWCMHDEAAPTYIDMLDNTALGHRWILQEFGVTPRVTWQIDPFGHSATQASLLSSPLAGFEALYFGRADYQERAVRQNATSLEYYWASSPNLGSSGQTFTGLLPGYGPPGQLCWDTNDCADNAPIQDDETLHDYNVDYFVNYTVAQATSMALNYKVGGDGTVHIMWPMGSDFQHTNSPAYMKNIDKLLHYVNANTSAHRVNLLYSTPSAYTDAKLGQGFTWPLKTDDGFPYADGPHAMWSGYFTSRPALKGFIRESSALHQAARQAQAFAGGAADLGPGNSLYLLERAMGVTQHHDSVSGTAKQHTSYDYAERLEAGRLAAAAGMSASLATLTGFAAGSFVPCSLANASICPPLEAPVAGQTVALTIWAQQGQGEAAAPIRVPVSLPNGIASWSVTASDGASPLVAQLLPASAADAELRTGYYGAPAAPMSWLAFQTPLPAAGFAVVFLTPTATAAEAPHTHASVVTRMKTSRRVGAGLRDQTLSNGIVTLTISASTGMLSGYANAANGVTLPLTQSWAWYNSSIGVDAPNDNTTDKYQPSGAYIFRPNASTPFPVAAAPAEVQLVTGPVVSEARQVVAAGWLSQVVRLWAGSSAVDISYTVGPIPHADGWGKEVIARYSTPLETAATWYTDSNLREMQKRVRNYRPSWNYTVFEPVAGNYVPVNGRIAAVDAGTGVTLTVATDRSQGGASMADGELELMVHRRLQRDDYRGVGEPLNEPGLDWSGSGLVIRGTHRLMLSQPSAAAVDGTAAMLDLSFPPLWTVASLPANAATPAAFAGAYKTHWSGLAAPLPANVFLATVQSHSPTTLLLRLAHLYSATDDTPLAAPANVSLTTLFAGSTLSACQELTLTANQPLSAVPVRTVQIEGQGAVTFPTLPAAPAGAAQAITIAPMEVRTFSCTVAPAA